MSHTRSGDRARNTVDKFTLKAGRGRWRVVFHCPACAGWHSLDAGPVGGPVQRAHPLPCERHTAVWLAGPTPRRP